MKNRAIIFVNGNLSDLSRAKNIITKDDCLIAADGGVKHILKLGLTPKIIVGDMDSTPLLLQKKLTKICREQACLFPTIIKYPTKKNKTDFKLVIDYVIEKKFKEIVIFGILGDRIDHLMANIFLLVKIQTENKSIKIKVVEGKKEIYILNKKIVVSGHIGDELSIIPVSEKLEGIITDGLEYQLNNETLIFGSTRGISNILDKTLVKINVKEGIALIVFSRK